MPWSLDFHRKCAVGSTRRVEIQGCKSAIVIKQARRGKNAGSTSWSCSQFPGCRGSRDYR